MITPHILGSYEVQHFRKKLTQNLVFYKTLDTNENKIT